MKIYKGLGQLLDGNSFVADHGESCQFEHLQGEKVKVRFYCPEHQSGYGHQLNLSQFDVIVFLCREAPDGSLEEIERREIGDTAGVIIGLREGEVVKLLFEARNENALHIQSEHPCLFDKVEGGKIRWSGTLLT